MNAKRLFHAGLVGLVLGASACARGSDDWSVVDKFVSPESEYVYYSSVSGNPQIVYRRGSCVDDSDYVLALRRDSRSVTDASDELFVKVDSRVFESYSLGDHCADPHAIEVRDVDVCVEDSLESEMR